MTTWLTLREASDYSRVSQGLISKAVKAGELAAYTIGSGTQYRLRAEDIDEWIMSRSWEPARYRTKRIVVAEPAADLDVPIINGHAGGMSRRSWLASLPGTNEYDQHPASALPEALSYKKVKPESQAVIVNMPELSDAQKKLLDRVRREQEVVLNNSYRKAVESLARRNLVTYTVTGNKNAYQFTVRPRRA